MALATEMANVAKLRAIIDWLDLPVSAVARIAGVSRPYVSRVLSDKDDLNGSVSFWRDLERGMSRLIETRRTQVFEIPAASTLSMERLKGAA